MNEVENMLEEMNKQVVSSRGYTRGQLSDAFDTVKDQTNWKNPIKSTIPERDFEIVHEAVAFFTGSTLSVRYRRPDETLDVYASGYYNEIGA